ncbi:MAG: GNAT family N-acetyltransferase [Paludibacteraceae bacterium]|nr:GNAT family N-acetyltransferase [Paludibacteraceae bacterium]
MTHIRKIQPEEIPVLNDFLYEAIFIPQGMVPPPRTIIEQEDLQVYVRGFGESPHDHCLVAECDGKIVGAVWVRMMNDYGHLDDQTPSLAISLYPTYRGQGIGTQLLRQMMDLLRQEGYAHVSLSVQKENYALRMYQKEGFMIVEDRGDEVVMRARL